MKMANLFPKEQIALDIILNNPMISVKELGDRMGISSNVASAYVSNLKKRGYIQVQKVFVPVNKELQISLN